MNATKIDSTEDLKVDYSGSLKGKRILYFGNVFLLHKSAIKFGGLHLKLM